MIPKAPRAAQVLIVLFAILVIAYVASVIHLSDDSAAGKRYAFPGQLIAVQMHSTWDWLRSSDTGVLVPVSVTLRPLTRGYFVALKPGTAALQALSNPCPINMKPVRCMLPERIWAVEIEIRPG